jgi:hypothetical protein
MLSRTAADLVLIVHLGFILFVVFGGFLALRWPKFAWIHIPSALWGASIEFMGWICPLTPLEIRLREAGGDAGYAAGFIEHYLLPLVYPAELSREIQFALGAAVVVVNCAAYALVWFRRQRASRIPSASRSPLEK